MTPPFTDRTADGDPCAAAGGGVPFSATRDGVRLAVRLAPGSAANRIDGIHAGADGRAVLKVAVTAPPEGGKANAALIKLLAKEWHLAKSAFAITTGATHRRKVLTIAGEPGALMDRLAAWTAARAANSTAANSTAANSTAANSTAAGAIRSDGVDGPAAATTKPRGTQP